MAWAVLPRSGEETPDFILRLSLPLNHRQAKPKPMTAARAAVKMNVVKTAAATPTEQLAGEDLVRVVEGWDGVWEGSEVEDTSVGAVVVAKSVKDRFSHTDT